MVDVIVGFLSGILSSMGFGGGSILMLYMTILKGENQRSAAGTNLIFFLPCATLSTILYMKKGIIKKDIVIPLMIGSALGAGLGAWLSMGIDVRILRIGFGLFLLMTGVKELFSGKGSQRKSAK